MLPVHVRVDNLPTEDLRTLHWAMVAAWAAIAAVAISAWQSWLAKRALDLAKLELEKTSEALDLARDELVETRKQSEIATEQFRQYREQSKRRSALAAKFPLLSLAQFFSDGTRGYRLGCNVANSSVDKGLDDFRLTVYLSPGCRIDTAPGTSSNFKFSVGATLIEQSSWASIQIDAGKIYADDEIWVATIGLKAPPGEYKLRWVIRSEDGRIPTEGFSEPEVVVLPK